MRTGMQMIVLLVTAWAAGLAAYAWALKGCRGEILSLDNWLLVGSITLVAWVLASTLVTLPVLRRLASRRFSRPAGGVLAAVGAALAILPTWLNLGVWYGWHPRHLLSVEAGLLAVLYGTSGVVLSLSVARIASRRETVSTRRKRAATRSRSC